MTDQPSPTFFAGHKYSPGFKKVESRGNEGQNTRIFYFLDLPTVVEFVTNFQLESQPPKSGL